MRSEGVQRGFLSERQGKVIPHWWTENKKDAGTNSGQSGSRNLEAESIRSGMESAGGYVKIKTVPNRNTRLSLFFFPAWNPSLHSSTQNTSIQNICVWSAIRFLDISFDRNSQACYHVTVLECIPIQCCPFLYSLEWFLPLLNWWNFIYCRKNLIYVWREGSFPFSAPSITDQNLGLAL